MGEQRVCCQRLTAAPTSTGRILNDNGVRDDIEAYIAALPTPDRLR